MHVIAGQLHDLGVKLRISKSSLTGNLRVMNEAKVLDVGCIADTHAHVLVTAGNNVKLGQTPLI